MGIYPYSAAVTGLVQIGSGSLDLWFLQATNTGSGAAECWLQVFNAADTGDVTLGTTAPIHQLLLPAAGGNTWQTKISCSRGCVIAATTTKGGATAVSVAVNVEARY